ncbi:hypothetical protein M5689_010197 [Euphorbia peplus]|nr:hypothetical protein M5689_010197 [Euphorbia peplus]
MASRRLWCSTSAKPLNFSIFRRGFSSVSKTIAEDQAKDELNKPLGGENSSPKKKKNAFIRTARGLGKDGILTFGSSMHLGEEDDGIYGNGRWIRIPIAGILFEVDDESGTILGFGVVDVNRVLKTKK